MLHARGMPQLLEVGREPPVRLPPLNDVGSVPHPTDREFSNGSREPDLPRELVRPLAGYAQQGGDLGSAHQIHVSEATAAGPCVRAMLVVLSSKQAQSKWPRRRSTADGAWNTSEVADRARS